MPTTDYLPLIDNHVTVKPGQALRLFPFGTLVKNGKKREITPELARTFRLPHFKAPIKLGSHEDDTPAGGFITSLEVRDDGLYGLTEVTEKGEKVFADGDYRYHSPEVIWEGAMEDPKSGEAINAPLIVGTALLHTPHLGEAAALYEVMPKIEVTKMTSNEEMVSVPRNWIERLFAREEKPGTPQPDPTPTPDPAKPDEYAAVAKERDDFKTKYETLQAEQAKAAKADEIKKLMETDEYGFSMIDLKEAPKATEILARMDDEVRDWVLQHFKALTAQLKASGDPLTKDVGATGNPGTADAVAQFDAAVKAEAEKNKLSYGDALEKVIADRPELYKAYQRAR